MVVDIRVCLSKSNYIRFFLNEFEILQLPNSLLRTPYSELPTQKSGLNSQNSILNTQKSELTRNSELRTQNSELKILIVCSKNSGRIAP